MEVIPLDQALPLLLGTALSLGAIHTLMGPDHYLPFIVLGRAEGWPLRKALLWTAVCGLGHVLSSVLLGGVGIALGVGVARRESLEGLRGGLAGLALIGFGAIYFGWGLLRVFKHKGGDHAHPHVHQDGSIHSHVHAHMHEGEGVSAAHDECDHNDRPHLSRHKRTLWALFIIFVLGPCEPLIPLVMFPASRHSITGVALVSAAYGVATLGVMLTIVWVGYAGVRVVQLRFMEQYAHALAGLAILISGLAIRFLGL